MGTTYIETLREKIGDIPNYEKFRLLETAGISKEEMKTIYPNELKTFSDLVFGPHHNNDLFGESCISAFIEFDNGHWVSVVNGPKGSGIRGNGKTTFEVGYPLEENFIDTFDYVNEKEITDIMIEIQMKYPFKNE